MPSALTIGGIRRKAGFAITITAATALLISTTVIYIAGFLIMGSNAEQQQYEITKTLAITASENIKGEIQDIETYASRILWKKACEISNQKYAGMSSTEIEKMLLAIDKSWINADNNDELVKKCVSGEISESMREIVQIRGSVSEIFITDKSGALVNSSERTSDFYQADEDWWQKTFNGGKGMVYMGPMEYDISSDKWGSTMAIPIKNSKEEVIGICKMFIHTGRLFDFINRFKLGETGHAFLTDDNGMILIHKGVAPLTTKILDTKNFEIIKNKKDWRVFTEFPSIHEKRSIFSICMIDSNVLKENGVKWYMMISQSSDEALRLLNIFLLTLLFVAILLIPMTIPIGSFLGSRISKPIDELSKAAERIKAGDSSQNIDIHTGDEIEQFADVFKSMLISLKNKEDGLLASKRELESLSSNQEGIINARTKDLTRAQEATLNILEDLVEAKSRLEKYSKDLEAALQIKSDFTSTVSHELRTPLAAIKEGIAIVLDGIAGETSAKQKEFLEIAKRNVDRLARLINDILDFQKLESGKMQFNMIQNDMNETIRDAASAMRPIIEKKLLKLILELDDKLPKIIFDKDKILQVLINLINNALKYTETGSIKIIAKKEANMVKVSVIDSGTGIRPEDIPKLFVQFTQLEKISDRKTGSTGLGLSICKEIMKAHNGKIWAESEYGKGSAFSFVLPIVDRRARNA